MDTSDTESQNALLQGQQKSESHKTQQIVTPPHPPSPCQSLNSVTYTLWFKSNSAWFLNKGKFRIFSSRIYASSRILSNIRCGTLLPLEHPMAFTGVRFHVLTLYKIFTITALSRKEGLSVLLHKFIVSSIPYILCNYHITERDSGCKILYLQFLRSVFFIYLAGIFLEWKGYVM